MAQAIGRMPQQDARGVAQCDLLGHSMGGHNAMGFSAYWSSQALALTQAGAMIGRVGWGVVSDRLFGGRRKVERGVGGKDRNHAG